MQVIFGGSTFDLVLKEIKSIHQKILRKRIFVALHMHAGDGNVHTNILVNSDDYEMLQDAHRAVDRIMVLARSLDGMISGEYGIGITKLEYLTDGELKEFHSYKNRVDPNGHFNKGKLMPNVNLQMTSTPKHCAYGSWVHHHATKCKPVCTTHVLWANLLCSPRDKILVTSLLIEAFLYEEQTRCGAFIRHWEMFDDVAGHCTVCHKCYTPCPVKIDFGDVTMNMRNLLRKMGQCRFNPGASVSMQPIQKPSEWVVK